jgi:hypothetical protein
MTEIKISDEDVELVLAVLPAGPWRHYDDYRKDALPHREAVARKILAALVASGWRREAEVLREAAEQLDSLLGAAMRTGRENVGIDAYAGATQVVDWLERRASEAEQYVSAGTREGEDQKRGEEQEHG